METDIGEKQNLYLERPEIVERLLGLLRADVARGRSTEGSDSANDIEEILLWKSGLDAVTKRNQRKKK